jgi:hypothetical protein
MPEPWELHGRVEPVRDESSPRSPRRARIVRALAVLGVLAGSLVLGSFVGLGVGEAVCDDPEYEMLRCFEEDTAGVGWGLISGLAGGIVFSLVLVARWRRT